MRVIELRRYVERQPFRPFRIFLSDGSVHEIGNPNVLLLTRDTVYLGILRPGDDLPRSTKLFDPLHITRIEPVEGPVR